VHDRRVTAPENQIMLRALDEALAEDEGWKRGRAFARQALTLLRGPRDG
jgi:hypothetical protein